MLGTLARTVGGGALGGAAGYALSPEDRKGYGTIAGMTGGALGAASGPMLLRMLSKQPETGLGSVALGALGTGLGTAAGIGGSQFLINKDTPDSAEDPYRYTQR